MRVGRPSPPSKCAPRSDEYTAHMPSSFRKRPRTNRPTIVGSTPRGESVEVAHVRLWASDEADRMQSRLSTAPQRKRIGVDL